MLPMGFKTVNPATVPAINVSIVLMDTLPLQPMLVAASNAQALAVFPIVENVTQIPENALNAIQITHCCQQIPAFYAMTPL